MRARKYLILSFILSIAMIPFPGCEDFDEDWDGNSGEGEVDGRLSIGGSDSGLKGTYFHNSDFSEEAFQRLDATINFDWGNGSPDRRLGSNTFSVRWTGFVTPEFSETYTFYTVSDDGIRLFVDGRRIIENWTDHAPTENRGTIALQAGKSYPIKLEFYENGGGAVARLLWSSRSRSRQTIPKERLSPIKKDKVENVALGKSASQSSTLVGAVASRAVDGNTSSSFWDGSVTHTKDSRSPWWRVDLGGAHRVDSVTLFNRTDCCSQRLSNFHVDLLDESGRVIAKKDHPRQAPTKTDISLAGSGVYAVRVQLYGTDPLSLAEVQVFGAPEDGDCHTYPPGHSSYCTSDCPCGENEGDCDRDSQCQDGLVCEQQSGTDFCVKPDIIDDTKSNLQVRLDGVWKGVCCNGGELEISGGNCSWTESGRVMKTRDLRTGNRTALDCPENGQRPKDCNCTSSGERMHGIKANGNVSVGNSLRLPDGAPIYPNSGHETCIDLVNGELQSRWTSSSCPHWRLVDFY